MTPKPQLYLPPSAASCWTVCTAQPAYVRDNKHLIPESTDTKWSIEGDQAHAAAELLVKEGKVPYGTSAEMARHAHAYQHYLHGLRDVLVGELYIERKVPLFYMPARNGKIDALILNHGEVHVVDLKYGAGIQVSAVENKQAAIYGRSAIEETALCGKHDLPATTMVHIHIFQPRNGGISTWSLTWGDLYDWTEEHITLKAEAIQFGGKVEFRPSDDTCRFCDAAGFCEARRAQLLSGFEPLAEAVQQAAAAPALPAATTLTVEQLQYIKLHGGEIAKWIKDVNEYLDARANAGHVLRGFKQVRGPGRRYFTDEDRAEKLLRQKLTAEEVRPSKLISPAQAEELLEGVELSTKFQKLFNGLIGKHEGNLLLVPLDDKRPDHSAAAIADFPMLDATDDCPI